MKVEFASTYMHDAPFVQLAIADRRQAKHNVDDSLTRVETFLDGQLELPPKVKVIFKDLDRIQTLAQVRDKKLWISIGKNSYVFKKPKLLDGLMGHETSHLSDEVTQNDCSAYFGLRQRSVSEGKAEVLAKEAVGSDHPGAWVNPRLDEAEEQLAYDRLLGQHRVATFLSQFGVGRHAGIGATSESLRAAVNKYRVGYTLVNDVMEWTDTGSVCDIHAQPTDFYVDTLRAHRPDDR
jgi:hypothetical protein